MIVSNSFDRDYLIIRYKPRKSRQLQRIGLCNLKLFSFIGMFLTKKKLGRVPFLKACYDIILRDRFQNLCWWAKAMANKYFSMDTV